MRFNVAQKIMQRIEHLHEDAQTATQKVMDEMHKRLSYTAGAITLDKKGEIGIYWTSQKMGWAYQKGDKVYSGVRKGQNFVEDA